MRFLGRKREFSEEVLYRPREQLLPAVQLDYCGYGADLEVRLLSVSNGSYANPQKSNRPLQEWNHLSQSLSRFYTREHSP